MKITYDILNSASEARLDRCRTPTLFQSAFLVRHLMEKLVLVRPTYFALRMVRFLRYGSSSFSVVSVWRFHCPLSSPTKRL